MLPKIIAACGTAFAIVRARQDMALGRTDRAATGLQRARTLMAKVSVPDDLGVEVDLLDAQIAVSAGNGPQALMLASKALTALKAGKGRFKEADRRYLDGYAEELVHYCTSWRDQRPMLREARAIGLQGVSGHIKRNFPLTAERRFGQAVLSA
jgi:predicted metal-dependent hydrolase